MEIPVRCFNCGKILNDKYDDYLTLTKTMTSAEALHKLGIDRDCCRSIILTVPGGDEYLSKKINNYGVRPMTKIIYTGLTKDKTEYKIS